jgi:hypothetical protein
MKPGDLVRLKDFGGRTFPLWKTHQHMYDLAAAGTVYPDEIAMVVSVDVKPSVATRDGEQHTTGLRVITCRGVLGWNNSDYFEEV